MTPMDVLGSAYLFIACENAHHYGVMLGFRSQALGGRAISGCNYVQRDGLSQERSIVQSNAQRAADQAAAAAALVH